MNNILPWQKKDWLHLQVMLKRPMHGLLFRGTKGIGKLDLAIKFARSLLCQHPDDSGFACGECPSCHWFEQKSHPDFRLLQPEALGLDSDEAEDIKSASGKKPSKQISVNQVRDLDDFFGMSAHQGGRRVIVIHPAEAMNANAANALLKNLEEPPQGLLVILVTHKPQQLPPTILSRCLSFALSIPDIASATRWLAEQGVSNPSVALALSGYSPLQAVQLDGLPGRMERDKLLQAIRKPSALDVFALADALQKIEQALVVQWLQQWCYDLGSMKLAGKLRYHPGEEAAIKRLVEPVAPLNLARLQKYLQTAKHEARHTLNPKLFFESILFTYSQLMLE